MQQQSNAGMCQICGRQLKEDEELYWDRYCPECAAKSMDDWNEDFENLDSRTGIPTTQEETL